MNERFKEFDDDKYITCFFLDSRFRNRPLKDKAYSRIVRCATIIGKRLGFDLRESRALCEQIKDYCDNKPLFDLDKSCSLDDPLNWWNLIDTDPQLNSLPRIAYHLLAICPTSASCERSFSTFGWLFNDWHLNLNINQLESMEKNNTCISETEMNIQIAEVLAETNDDDDECDVLLNKSLPNQITIPPDNCIVLIEHIWIDKFVDLSHKL
ncbi:hypothetical protein RhiirB3_456322, partial [Rhizophagus irregularis]